MPASRSADDRSPFAAALLAGGRSERMGRDKAWLEWQGQPLWQVQLAKLQSLGAERVLLSCRKEQGLAQPGVEAVFDPPGEDAGPIGAITRCLALVQMPLLVMAVDMPWMPLEFLRDGLVARQSGGRGLFYVRQAGYEPLAGFYTVPMLELLRPAIAAGRLGLQAILAAAADAALIDVMEATAEETFWFRNANWPQDWPK